MPQYDRVVEVLIGPAGTQQQALSVTDLRVSFSVKKSATTDVNTCQVDIFNLNPEQRAKLKETGQVMVLKAGYADATGAEILFRGDITLTTVTKNPVDIITRIECGDGTEALLNTRASLTYKEGASAKQVLRDLLKKLPLPKRAGIVDSVINSVTDSQYANAFASSGQVKDAMDKVAEKLGLEWSIQDNEVKVVPVGEGDGTQPILVAPRTGMIEAPERSLNIVKKSVKRGIPKDRPGWTVRSLLLPFAEPGGVAQIEANEIPNGSVFRIESVTHSGDNYGKDWMTELDVTDLQ